MRAKLDINTERLVAAGNLTSRPFYARVRALIENQHASDNEKIVQELRQKPGPMRVAPRKSRSESNYAFATQFAALT
ncbi:hypothetical protein RS75_22405 [Rhizobium nepotum 39/7]|uniref:Transposase n=1 Tax=Rhizobium nepotum 39/7 TaxID=1368418 RepID=A0ABR5CLF9_9HYPH|nr:hypothetical protein RS75_22405 [Rhizobium nepotum 39/7]